MWYNEGVLNKKVYSISIYIRNYERLKDIIRISIGINELEI